jgi:predicted ATPase
MGEDDREPTLAPDGHGLPVLLDAILGRDRAAWDEILDELRVAVPYVRSIRLKPARIPRPQGPQAGKALFFELRNGAEIPASLASQGVLLFLAYLALVHAATPPSILLVEEPENGIHPRQLQRVAEYLKRLADPARGKDAVQIVAATHSPYFLDFVPPEAVLVFGRRESGETVVRPLLSLPGVKERLDSGFSLGEMWFNVGEDRLLAEALA